MSAPVVVRAVPLEYAGVRLEPLAEAHRAGLRAAGKDPTSGRTCPTRRAARLRPLVRPFARDRRERRLEAVWAVRSPAGLVGSTRFLAIESAHRRLEIGSTWYAPQAWGTRVNPACKLALMRYAFEDLRFNRVEYKTDIRNVHSQAAIAKLGAVREGVFRAHMVRPDGSLRNSRLLLRRRRRMAGGARAARRAPARGGLTMRQWMVDAFAERPFRGNPACVVEPFDAWPASAWMQALAAENNQAETAFLLRTADPARFGLRWMTPALEVPLCGHATLASAHVLFDELGSDAEALTFDTRSGPLIVRRAAEGFEMDFPADRPAPTGVPDGLAEALGAEPAEVWTAAYLIVVLESEAPSRRSEPDIGALHRISTAFDRARRTSASRPSPTRPAVRRGRPFLRARGRRAGGPGDGLDALHPGAPVRRQARPPARALPPGLSGPRRRDRDREARATGAAARPGGDRRREPASICDPGA